jgi:hypothetical protein
MAKAALLTAFPQDLQHFEKSAGVTKSALEAMVDENIALKKSLEGMQTKVAALVERVEKLASEPEPAKGFKRMLPGQRVMVIDKQADVGSDFSYGGVTGDAAVEAYAKYLDTLTPERRQLEMIKLAQRNPILRVENR